MLKEREAQLEMKKIVEQMKREEEAESVKQLELLLKEKEKLENEKFKQKQHELDKVVEFNKKRY